MKKIILSIFMISSTTIGGSMIALPVVSGPYGLMSALLLLTGICLFNMLLAFLFLEATMALPEGSNLIIMSEKLLGRIGAAIAWAATILFFYSLLASYTAGLSEIVANIISLTSITFLKVGLMIGMSILLFAGESHIFNVNKYIVTALFGVFVLLCMTLVPHIQFINFQLQINSFSLKPIPMMFTSFGFLAVIPSIRQYLSSNIRSLKIVIIVGSLLPLVIYMLWEMIAFALIPTQKMQLLVSAPNAISALTNMLITQSQNKTIKIFIESFVFFAIAGSFIGTSLALFDCLSDALKIRKNTQGKLVLICSIFIPLMSLVLLTPRVFIIGLHFAGLLAVILFGFYPILMTWSLRHIKKIQSPYQTFLNKNGVIVMFFVTSLLFLRFVVDALQ